MLRKRTPRPFRIALPLAAVSLLPAAAPAAVLVNANFDADANGFAYQDDSFRATAKPAYASGTRVSPGGRTGGGLQVKAGGIDNVAVTGMSGGWKIAFTLPAAADVKLTFAYNLDANAAYEADEYGEVLASLDGALLGTGGTDYVRRIADGGVSGWQTVTLTKANVAAGSHTVMLGAYSNKKTELAEQTTVTLDDVVIESIVNDVYVQDAGPDGIVSMEAERFAGKLAQGGRDWVSAAPAGASGTALQAMPNTGGNVNTGYVTGSPRLDFKVKFQKTGTHWIWARGMAANGDDDSYHAGLDGAAIATSDRISGFGTGWTWVRADMDGGQANFNVATAAQRVVNAWMREDGLILDKIVLTTNSAYVPTGTGPAESPRTGSGGNVPPVADAGPGLFTLPGKSVTLDGSRSADGDGPSALTYAWTQTAGPGVTLTSANTAKPSFTAGGAGLYTFRNTVSDGAATASATVNVRVLGTAAGILNLAEATLSHDAANLMHADFPAGLYDNDLGTHGLINYDPGIVNLTLAFAKPVSANGMGIVQHQEGWFSLAGANSLADLDAKTGSYQLILNMVPNNPDAWTRTTFPQSAFRYWRVSSKRVSGDGFVHIAELELSTPDRFQTVPFVQPRGLAVDAYGRKLVADAGAGRIFALDASGACTGEIGAGNLTAPYDIAIDAQGNLLVADFGGNRIQKFAGTGDFISTLIGSGTGPGKVSTPTGIALDGSGRIYVSEAGPHRVQRFLATGAIDASFGGGDGAIGTHADPANGDHFDHAADVHWEPVRKQVVVADKLAAGPAGHSRIRVFNEAGALQRTIQGLNQLESVARDATGTIYAVGGVAYHNDTMGALRIIGPADEFAVNVWRNGSAWPGKTCAGVAVDAQGRVHFSDLGKRRLHTYEAGKVGDIHSVNVKSGPTWMEISWKTHVACPTRVLWGVASPSAEAGDNVATKDHVWRVNGLQSSKRYVIAPLYPRAMDGALVAGKTEAAATEPAAAGKINVLKIRTAGLIYTHGMTPEDVQKIRDVYRHTRQFFLRNGYGRFWMDMPDIEISRALTEAEMDDYGPSPATVEADLAARGYSASNPVDLCVISYRDNPKGNWGGGAVLFGRNVGYSRFVTESPFVVIHEVNHAIDAMFSANGMEKYDHNHGLWNVEFGINGGDGTLNGEIMRRVFPANILALSATHGVLVQADDADGDGLSESAFLPTNETTVGSFGNDADSDDDGLTDLQEMMSGIHHKTDPKAKDTDGDAATQGDDKRDRNPLLNINGYVARGTPSLDGVFSPSEGWTLVSNGNNLKSEFEMGSVWKPVDAQAHLNTKIWSAWDANGVYFAMEFTRRPQFVDKVIFRTDNNNDGWYYGLDNHNLEFDDFGIQSNRIHGITQDISNLLGDGGWGEINDDETQWTNDLAYAPLFNHDVQFRIASLGGDRHYVEFRLPAGARRKFQPAAGKAMSFRVSHEVEWNHYDTLMELDAGARLLFVEPIDTDGDGMWDLQEVDLGRNPNVPG